MKEDKQVVQVFAKTPIIGHVKTRLIPLLGSGEACELHKKMTFRLIKDLDSDKYDIQIWTDKDLNHEFFKEFSYPMREQIGKDLGQKMGHALSSGLSTHQKVMLVGTDLPELDNSYLEKVSDDLNRFQIVIGPTLDGGFGLLAARDFDQSMFEDIVWSSSGVLRVLCRNLIDLKLSFHLSKTLWDVDQPADYDRFKRTYTDKI
tara:strand:- start:70 stop:678 length:609 start_codon:yes stop_codon:yes gene_type:complete